jgi:hypothetical protein
MRILGLHSARSDGRSNGIFSRLFMGCREGSRPSRHLNGHDMAICHALQGHTPSRCLRRTPTNTWSPRDQRRSMRQKSVFDTITNRPYPENDPDGRAWAAHQTVRRRPGVYCRS